MMKPKLLYISLLVAGIIACNSPVKQHNKEMQHKANKLQNVQSGPLSNQKDTAGSSADAPGTASSQ